MECGLCFNRVWYRRLLIVGTMALAVAVTQPTAASEVAMELTAQITELARIGPDQLSTVVQATVDESSRVSVVIVAATEGLETRITGPHGEVLEPDTVESFGGSYFFVHENESTSAFLITHLGQGGHKYVYEFPSLGAGTYSIFLGVGEMPLQSLPVIVDVLLESPIRGSLFVTEGNVAIGKMAIGCVSLLDGQTPVIGATVSLEIKPPVSELFSLALLDDGDIADGMAQDGLYCGAFPVTDGGLYFLLARAESGPPGATFSRTFGLTMVGYEAGASIRVEGITSEIIDDNANGLFDRLVVAVPVDVTLSGEYSVAIVMRTPMGKVLQAYGATELNVGMATIGADLLARSIRETGESGPYTITDVFLLRLSGAGAVVSDSRRGLSIATVPFVIDELEHDPIELTGLNSDVGIDADGDGDFDVLQVRLGVNVVQPGIYAYSVRLMDPCNEEIEFIAGTQGFPSGAIPERLALEFEGARIGSLGSDGPYVLRDLLLLGPGGSLSSLEVHRTFSYLASEFDGFVLQQGRCCLPSGSCAELTALCCTLNDGVSDGAGTDCDAEQACCLSGECIMTDRVCCGSAGGVPQGQGTVCNTRVPCCLANGVCEQLDSLCCVEAGGSMDLTPPSVNCPPAYETVECDESPPPFDLQFEDDCDSVVIVTPSECTVQAGACAQARTVRCEGSAMDHCGNVSTCASRIDVVDSVPPVVQCEGVIVVQCTSVNGIAVEDVRIPEPSVNDNCDSNPTVAGNGLHSGFYPPTCDGSGTVVSFIAEDECGNRGSCESEVRVIGAMCCPTETDTDVRLMIADLDLRQDTAGPYTTKARFDVWNSNEVRFSGTQRCVTCWDEALISGYGPIANHLTLANLQTDKGKARIRNNGYNDDVSGTPPCVGRDGPSVRTPLLGVAIAEHHFRGSPHVEMRSGVTLVGMGEQAARIQYDISQEPEEGTSGDRGRGDGVTETLVITQVPGTLNVNPAAGGAGFTLTLGDAPLALPRAGDATAVPSLNTDSDTTVSGGVASNRASTTFKGSLVAWPMVEVKWNASGTLIQDTFIYLLNDYPGEVKIRFYQVNGDAPLDPVIDPATGGILERAHPGWNWGDYQVTLTGDESAYWSVASGLPKGVLPIAVLDSGNPNGRPDLDPSNPGGRVIRGFLVGWAVNDDGAEIRWNHLEGHAVSVRYDHGTAYDYNPWSFRVVSGVDHGAEPDDDPGKLNLNGIEYDFAPNSLLFDFFAAGTQAFSHPDVRP